ncbi:hypothetical protein CROQUDRAFT_102434 [Cronartium quercuum f. sp. fusiforme G11]|uniref:Uncharacterized protein n=1 Tax=Cronartium quercuum f. sp. fusiforme G11 TaxID=708437 RepID=A0A9P6N7A9_9BASI|nr:hypothetical protein CROQUDRAFT_102434 [Cronartium quercuum f. sp. fusiforme G11]
MQKTGQVERTNDREFQEHEAQYRTLVNASSVIHSARDGEDFQLGLSRLADEISAVTTLRGAHQYLQKIENALPSFTPHQ